MTVASRQQRFVAPVSARGSAGSGIVPWPRSLDPRTRGVVPVEAMARLPAEHPGGDHVAQAGRGAEAVTVRLLERCEHAEKRVEPVEVTELERPHREVESEPEGGVDVLG